MDGFSGNGNAIFSTDAGSIVGRRLYNCQIPTAAANTTTAAIPIRMDIRFTGDRFSFSGSPATVTLGSIKTR